MNIQEALDEFENLIIEAFDTIPQCYYKLKTTYNHDGIVRERLFCYELYYRIRCLQEERQLTGFNIHGEIDKRGHELFDVHDRNNPDFVFHKPGTMNGNLIVVEVKGKLVKNGIYKDCNTLYTFCNNYHYGKGLWLVYNYSYNEITRIIQKTKLCFGIKNANIDLVCKENADSILHKVPFSDLL